MTEATPFSFQVLEMYSSGGDLHLELPSGATEGPQALWEIPPYTTKSVMKANFIARLENNHTAYIRIKTNTTGAEFLYLPLEVEVSSAAGLYCPQVRRGFILYYIYVIVFSYVCPNLFCAEATRECLSLSRRQMISRNYQFSNGNEILGIQGGKPFTYY